MNTLPSRTTKSVRKATAQRIQAIALNAFWHLVRLMPPAASAATGSAIFRFVGPRTRKQAFIRRNLARVFPRHEPRQIEAVAREVWGNFGAVLAEYPHLHYYCSDASAPDFDIHVAPETAAIVASRQPAVYVAAHLANWELATAAITRLGIPFSAVYAPQGNPSVDRMLQERRHALGCRFIGKNHAIRRLIGELGAGRSVGLLSDQRSDAGELLPFFGSPAMTTISPAWLALRFGCPLIPVRVERIGPARYRTSLCAPLTTPDPAPDRAGVIALSCALNALFESWIRSRPEQWLCMRRRWPAPENALSTRSSLQPCN